MKILHINTHELFGGAARAAYRLHKGLNKHGINSQILVQYKQSDENSTLVLGQTFFNRLIEKIFRSSYIRYFSYRYKPQSIFSINRVMPSELIKNIKNINPDIIHLHWITDQFINLHDLIKLNKPIIWTLHDEWAITGGCHINHRCFKFHKQCEACPVINSHKRRDLSYQQFNLKKDIYTQIPDMIFNGVSKWTAQQIKQSKAIANHQVVNLPNTIDIDLYKPVNKNIAREILNFEIDKQIILFGAVSSTSDSNKGFDLLIKALQLLPEDKYQLLIFGSSIIEDKFKTLNAKSIGSLHDDYTLKILYSAANVMVVPSRQENLSNTIMESLSCGTPVVAFDIGGNSDMIEHQTNGYLVKAFDCADLALGIEWVIDNPEYEQLAYNARKKIVDNFSEQVVIPKYIELYKNLL